MLIDFTFLTNIYHFLFKFKMHIAYLIILSGKDSIRYSELFHF